MHKIYSEQLIEMIVPHEILALPGVQCATNNISDNNNIYI